MGGEDKDDLVTGIKRRKLRAGEMTQKIPVNFSVDVFKFASLFSPKNKKPTFTIFVIVVRSLPDQLLAPDERFAAGKVKNKRTGTCPKHS